MKDLIDIIVKPLIFIGILTLGVWLFINYVLVRPCRSTWKPAPENVGERFDLPNDVILLTNPSSPNFNCKMVYNQEAGRWQLIRPDDPSYPSYQKTKERYF